MGVPSVEPYTETHIDTYPLLMERAENHSRPDHIIDIRADNASSSISCHDRPNNLEMLQNEDRSSNNSTAVIASQPSVPSTNNVTTRTSTSGRRADSPRHSSPLNSGTWISIHLVVTMSQIIASIVVLSVSKDEHPHAPLFVWIVGYASGCVATLPILYWRFRNRNQVSEQGSAPTRQNSAQVTAGPFSVSVSSGLEGVPNAAESRRAVQNAAVLNARLNALMEYFKMVLDCFFAVWFVVGNIWIFGGHASATEAPNMYRLCIVFLTFSCIGYAMPFILCATICCCLPCIISILGFREDQLSRTRGATTEAIDALPTYKFKLKKTRSGSNRDNSSTATDDSVGGGVIAAGTAKERTVSAEDAVCCICLAKYGNNEELRELPCSHFFHKECVDKWLKINALCPLCKNEVNPSVVSTSEPAANAAPR